jgi:hypothetical protein
MSFLVRRWRWLILLLVLGHAGGSLEASRWKQAAAAAMALALLTSGEPLPGPPLPPGADELPDPGAGFPLPEWNPELPGTCSRHCSNRYWIDLIRCESLPMLLRNLCLSKVLVEVKPCLDECAAHP